MVVNKTNGDSKPLRGNKKYFQNGGRSLQTVVDITLRCDAAQNTLTPTSIKYRMKYLKKDDPRLHHHQNYCTIRSGRGGGGGVGRWRSDWTRHIKKKILLPDL